MNELQLHELLDSYLDRSVSYRQLQADLENTAGVLDVAALVQQHTIAAAAVEQFGILQSIKKARVQHQQTIQLVAPVVPVIDSHTSSTQVVSISWMKRFAAAAAVFVIGLSLWSVISMSGAGKEQIFSDLNETYTLNTVRTNGVTTGSDLVEAFRAGQYKQVIELYGQTAAAGSRDMFFTGYSYMQLEDYTMAAVVLEKLLENNAATGQMLYNDDAEYYLALSRMQLGNYESAYRLLKQIYSQPAHTYHSNVTLMQLARIWWLK